MVFALEKRWLRRLALSATGFAVCAGILALLTYERFTAGGWAALLIIAAIVGLCIAVRMHYDFTRTQIRKIDAAFEDVHFGSNANPPKIDPEGPTAVFMVGSSRGGGMHALLWVQRMFQNHFRNFVFAMQETGAGPGEVRKVTAAHVNLQLGV